MLKIKHHIHTTSIYSRVNLTSSSAKLPRAGTDARELTIRRAKINASAQFYERVYGDLQDKILTQVSILRGAVFAKNDQAMYRALEEITKALDPAQCVQLEEDQYIQAEEKNND